VTDLGHTTASGTWHILSVMRKGDGPWVALLIDRDPALGYSPDAQSRWIELGPHKSLEDASRAAEEAVATRH
jgi:hypothetical protein